MMQVLLVLALAAPDGGVARDAPQRAKVVPGPARASHASGTACAACHATSSWSAVRFDHRRTGFELVGRHAAASCKACHVTNFEVPVPRACVGCHRDVHGGELGARCEGCHESTDWRTRFDVEMHRRTNFPLMGAHAAIPCVECHAEARERRFSRAVVDCQGCHAVDAQRTQVLGKPVNHVALGLDQQNCRTCHGALSFTPARFPTHDICFPISSGPHAGVPCLQCHSTLQGAGMTAGCQTGTAQCTQCHTNDGAPRVGQTDVQHAAVGGYQWRDRRCVECHVSTGGAP